MFCNKRESAKVWPTTEIAEKFKVWSEIDFFKYGHISLYEWAYPKNVAFKFLTPCVEFSTHMTIFLKYKVSGGGVELEQS